MPTWRTGSSVPCPELRLRQHGLDAPDQLFRAHQQVFKFFVHASTPIARQRASANRHQDR
jgi:hypothetical protein